MKKYIILLLSLIQLSAMAQENREIIYVGTFSEKGSKGIYVLDFDRETMSYSEIQTVHDKKSPSFLALHPNKKYLYAAYREGVNENDKAGTIISYAIDPKTGRLSKINQVSSMGASPCHISVDPNGNVLFVSHYQGGNLSTFKILEGGRLSESVSFIQHEGSSVHPGSQTQARMHSMIPSKDGKWVYASDLGMDQILKYKVNAKKGSLNKNPKIIHTNAGAGPRHFVLHPFLPYAYSVEELSSTVGIYEVQPGNGDLKPIGREEMLSPHIQSDFNAAADIQVTNNGKWLYASNRGQDNIVMYQINVNNGLLSLIGHVPSGGEHPRNIKIDERGVLVWVANGESGHVALFKIDQDSGKLIPLHKTHPISRAVFVDQLFLGTE
ncbi:MAG: lactonase family protein [Cyclobacteriaceae bacterium]